MIQSIDKYSTIVFDCDGVILDSNKVKTQAFYQCALPYGDAAAQALADYHVANGGVSRYKKIAYFLDSLVPQYAGGVSGPDLDEILADYANTVRDGLLTCAVANGLHKLRSATLSASWLIVSGGDQLELRDIFSRRKIIELFDGGIFGSPDPKEVILAREIKNGNIKFPALFIGDSKYDYACSISASIDFLFLSKWSEVTNFKDWCLENDIVSHSNLLELIADI